MRTPRATPGAGDDLPAVVLGGAANAVSVARSLAGIGVRVYALGPPRAPVRRSSACHAFVAADGGVPPQAAWLDWLGNGAPRGAVLVPCDDDGLELIARHRRTLEALGHVPIEADDDVLLGMLDKARTYDLAARAGVPIPRTVIVRDDEPIREVADAMGYPCALKPLHSHVFRRHFGSAVKVLVAADAKELEELLERTAAAGVEMMVTETICGPDDEYPSYYGYLDAAGDPLFHFTKLQLRQFPIGFGSGSYHRTTWEPDVAEMGLRFMQGVGMRGLGAVQFKRDGADGRLKLIECNHRITAANGLLKAAGLDLGLFLYNRALARPLPQMHRYRVGLGLWYPLLDARAFLGYRRAGRLSTRAWLASLRRRQTLPLASVRDPGPSAAHLQNLLGKAARRATAMVAPRR
jgi:D-aspartate ligase